MTRKILFALSVSLLLSAPALAQTAGHLRQYFEGTDVVLKIDMPATKEGVNLRADRLPRVDLKKYQKKLSRYGTAIHEGEAYKVTFVKVKKKHIEFHLGGGGYGAQYVRRKEYPPTPQSKQEINLEAELLTMGASYPEVRRAAKERLDGLRAERAQEDARLAALAAEEYAVAKRRVRQLALVSGSRFNVRFKKRVPQEALTPEGLMEIMSEQVEFSTEAVEEALKRQEGEKTANPVETAEDSEAGPPADSQAVANLHKGLLWDDVVTLLGRPSNREEWKEGTLLVKAGTFASQLGNVEAEFVEDVLVRYTLTSR